MCIRQKNVMAGRDRSIHTDRRVLQSTGTPALTAISSWCGNLCAKCQWKIFEKLSAGEWEERKWVGCFTVGKEDTGIADENRLSP